MWEDMGIRDSRVLDDADRAYRKWVKSEITKGNVVGWIVEDSEHVAAGGGCLWLRPSQPRPQSKRLAEPYLLSMFTEPDFRRKGVASRIVKEAMEWCERNGYARFSLHASRKGRRLYRRHGFTRTWEMRLELGKRKPRRRG
jgi:GNAT superfamily N-acetyltransferase